MKRRFAGIATLLTLVTLVVSTPAHAADSPGLASYGATADGTALLLNVLGQELTIGQSHADLDSVLKANAKGIGLATPLYNGTSLVAAAVGDNSTNGSADETCADAPLPDLPVVSLDAACGTALAKILGGKPSAFGAGKVASIKVGVADLLADTPLKDVADQLQVTVDQLLTALDPVFQGVKDNVGVDASTLLQKLLDAILQQGNLLDIQLGGSTSSTEVTDSAVLSVAHSAGAIIKVLDRSLPVGGAPALGPVLTITVGQSETTVTRLRSTGVATAAFTPALVTVKVADDIAQVLGLPPTEVSVPVGQDLCLPLPDPLASCIHAGSGAKDDAAGTAHADAVRLELLKGLPGGGITLALASAQSAVAAVPAVITPATPDAPRGSLPRTGGSTPLAATLGMAGVAVIGLALSRRSRPVAA